MADVRRALGWLAATVAALGLAVAASAAEPPRTLRFEAFNRAHGLEQESVLSLLQDRDGFLWFGTQAGLTRYDGYRSTSYRADAADPDAIADNWVAALHEDSTGRLWIGTRGGLQYFDAARNVFATAPLPPGGAGAPSVRALLGPAPGSRRGEFWIATSSGLLRMQERGGNVQAWRHDAAREDTLPSDDITALARDATGRLWIGSTAGLARLSADGRRIERFRLDSDAAPDARHNAIAALRTDAAGRLWIGTGAGLEAWTLDGAVPQRRRFGAAEGFPVGEVQALLRDRDGAMWVGTRNTGLLRWDPGTGRFLSYREHVADPHGLGDVNVMSLYQDRSGTLWVGTRTAGASRVDLGSRGFERHAVFDAGSVTKAPSKIYAIAEGEDGVLWLGSVGGGLHRFDRRSGQTRTFRHDPADPASLPDDTVMALQADGAGGFWVGTYRGLAHFDPGTGRFAPQWRDPADPATERVRRIATGPDGVLWLGSEGGLVRHDPATAASTPFRHDPDDPRSIGPGWVVALHFDRRGQLWIGTDATVDRLLPDGSGFARLEHDPARPDSFNGARVSHIAEDRHGRLWIGTSDGLLRIDDPRAAQPGMRRYGRAGGMESAVIGATLEDAQGRLWISTTAGLMRMDPDSGRVRNYSSRDGLIDGSFYVGAAFATADGTLLFGGPAGLNEFRPDALRDNATPPTVAITDVQLSNRALDPRALPDGVELAWPLHRARTLRLAHGHPVLTLEFAALHYADPLRNRYAYRLRGFDPDWIAADATRRYATYTNLDPGDYVFEVKAANKDGLWNNEPTRLAITVLPPWWATWWFRAAAALAAALVLWGAYRFRVRGLTRQREVLQYEVARAVGETVRQKEAVEQAHQTLTALGEIGREITASLHQGAVLRTLDRHVHGLLDASTFGVYLIDDDGRGLTSVWRREGGETLPVRRVEADDPIANVALCARQRRELQVDIAPGEDHPTHIPGTLRSLSMLFAPLLIGERLLGVMTIQSPAPQAYGERERVIFRSLCAYGAIGLDNAAGYRRLAEADAEVQRVLRERQQWLEHEVNARTSEMARQKLDIEVAHATLSVLGEIGREITATLDESEVCQTLDRHVHGLLDAVTFVIYRLDPDGRALTSILRMEQGRALPVASIDIDNPTRLAARCARERQEFALDLAAGEVGPSHVPGTVDSRSMLFAPLVVGDRLLGVMTIQSPREHAYGERERLVFRTLSAYGAIALDNAAAYRRLTEADAEVQRVLRERQQWLEQEVQARTAEVVRQKEDLEQAHQTLTVLGEIGREITATLDEGALFSTLERRVRDLLDATSIGIYRLDEADQALESVMFMEAGAHLPPERLALANPTRNAARCARERRELLIDVAPDEVNPSHIPGTLHTLSALFAPLSIGERLLGVMTIQSPRRHAYGERERLVFRTLCAYGAIALDNAAAYRRLAEADAGVQRVLREQHIIFDNIAAAVFFVKDRVIRRCNRGTEEMLGYDPGELIDQPTRIYHPSDASWQAMGEEIYPKVNAGLVAEGEWEIVRKDGTPIWIAYRGRAVDPGNEAEGTIWVAQDITERKRTAAALERALREQQALFDNEVGAIMLTRGRVVMRCNRGLEQILGYGPGELDGIPTRRFYKSDADYEELFARALPVLSAGGIIQGEVEYVRKDGGTIWIAYSGKAIDPADLGQGIIWSGQDIGSQKGVQAALKKSLQEFEVLFANFTGGIAIVRGGVFHRCNRRFEEMLGYAPGEALGLPEQQGFIPVDEWAAFVRAHGDEIARGYVVSGESEYVRRDGEKCWVLYQARMIDPGDPAQGVLWFGHDITERRLAEAELDRIRREQRIILDNSPGGGILLTRDRIIVNCNRGLEDLLGYAPGTLAGKPARINFPDDESYEAFGRWAYPILAAGGTARGEVRYLDSHGESIDAYVAGKAIDPADLSQGVVWMATDLRQQKKDAAELDRVRRELQIIFDNNIGAIAIVREGRLERCSRGFLSMYGYESGEALGMSVEAFSASPEESVELGRATTPELQAGNVVSGEFRYRRKDGSVGWMVYQGRALAPPDLDQGTIWLCQDISALKAQEAALRDSKAHVEQSLHEVEQLNRQVTLLGELTGFLQACPSAEEAFACIGEFGPRLFPDSAGALFLADEDGRAWLEHGGWGGAGHAGETFGGGDCWALRRSRAYRVDAPAEALCCPHVRAHGVHDRAYACLPLTAQGKTFGLLHLVHAPGVLSGDAVERRHGMAVAMADQIALAIANVQLREQLLQQSIRDPLTGLFNRRHLQEALFRECARAKREQGPVALLMIDVDHFKRCNDRFGHPAGDLVLQAVARVLEAQVRQGELACRFGGEEFAILLPGCDLDGARRVGDRVLDGVRGLVLTHEGRPLDRVTVSLGVALCPRHGSSPQSLVDAADAALYAAKEGGRDRLVVSGQN